MKHKLLFFIFSAFLGLAFLSLALKKVGILDVASALNNFTSLQVLVILALTVLIVASRCLGWRTILFSLGEAVSWRALLQARIAEHAMSFFTPVSGFGGEPAQYLIMKQNSKFQTRNLVASIIIDKIYYATINLLIIISGVVLLFLRVPLSGKTRLIILSAVLLLLASVIFVYWRAFRGQGLASSIFKFFGATKGNSLLKKVEGAEKPMQQFFNFRNFLFWKALFFSLGRGILYLSSFYFIVYFLGRVLTWEETFLIAGTLLLAGLIPVPFALGSLELSQAFVFGALGFSPGAGVAMVLIIRVFDLGLAAIGVVIILQKTIVAFASLKDKWLAKLWSYF